MNGWMGHAMGEGDFATSQVLREEIGTAVRQIKSRADQFSLIMHGQEGEGEEKEGFLKKEGSPGVWDTENVSHQRKLESRISCASICAS